MTNDSSSVSTNTSSTVSMATDSSHSSNGSGIIVNKSIVVAEKFDSWKLDGQNRYLLPHILCQSRVEEKMTVEKHASDAVVWNILHLNTNQSFPVISPTAHQRADAILWLNRFKRYLNKVIGSEVRMKYCNIANQPKWNVLREGGESFSCFEDLVKRTKYGVGKEVRI